MDCARARARKIENERARAREMVALNGDMRSNRAEKTLFEGERKREVERERERNAQF